MNHVGWVLAEPRPAQQRGMNPRMQPGILTAAPHGKAAQRDLQIFCVQEERALARSSHEGYGMLGSVPSSRSKISLNINAQGMPQKNNYLLGLAAGTDSLGVFSCPFFASV